MYLIDLKLIPNIVVSTTSFRLMQTILHFLCCPNWYLSCWSLKFLFIKRTLTARIIYGHTLQLPHIFFTN